MSAAVHDVAVIGAGIAGASVAAELARHMRVVLVESEAQPGYHATGRSAAILAQTYGNRLIRALTRASAGFFAAPPDGFAPQPLLSPRGLVRVATAAQVDDLRAMYDDLSDTRHLAWLDAEAMQERVPLLRPGYAAGGFENVDAQDIDVHAMLTGYLRQFRQAGGTVMTGAPVLGLTRSGGRWEIETAAGQVAAGVVVNAAGAWGDWLAGLAGAAPVGLEPRRRTAITFAAPQGFDPARMPMVVDADEAFYLKPEAGRLMASPADETLSAPEDSRPEEIDIAICADRIQTAFDLEIRRIESSWSGLRTFAADRAPVCGYDPEVEGFFWLVGQGGYGVQTAPALSRLAAALVRREAPDHDILSSGVTVEDVAPGRDALAKAKDEEPGKQTKQGEER
ncbi:FAD-binding oxidoreductase [Oceanicola sp. 22II-s10i]|uniref:NAD(P)/FAD-dependent oxidoreductase n=1 Tax=Oceanicola sp. 22II-s10i TaxID=1317116 RepID=UPI0020CFCCFE|nr:FAD-dependent oxidoreductase [Oceanicola sp. 22II-s10i]